MHLVTAGTPWLSLFGRPALIPAAPGPPRPLDCRYRKTGLLLAWLDAHADRPQPRGALAERFWPQAAASVARGNLRVLLNDLAARLSAVGLGECLETDRDWLCLRPAGRFVDDEAVLKDGALQALFHSVAEERLTLPWLPAEGIEVEGELAEWLAARQAWFARQCEARLHGQPPSSPPAPAVLPAPTFAAPAANADRAATWQYLTLLHLIPTSADPLSDERKRLAAARADCLALAAEAERLGARTLESDGTLTAVFGLDERAAGSRWQAWRAAFSLRRLAPTARIGLAAGDCRVVAEKVSGERLELVHRLGLCAEPGELVADENFAALAAGTGRAETREFRGFAAPMTIWRVGTAIHCPQPGSLLVRETRFVGRAKELAKLDELAARRSVPLCLVGPPGIGKSRLAAQFSQRHAPAFWLGCRAELAAQPWATLYEFLSRPDISARLDAGQYAVALRQFLAHRHLGFEWRGQMLAALASLFQGALIVIDDAHWLDEPCARLFDELAQRMQARWLLTRRPLPGGWLPAATACVELPPLDDAAASALLDAAGDTPLADAERRAAIARCRGNPLLLLAERRQVLATVREGLARQLAFPPAQTRLIGLAALLGQCFRRSELLELAPEAPVDDTLTLAAERGLIVIWNDDQCGFVHPLLRERSLDQLDEETIRQLAVRAASRLADGQEFARAGELFARGGKTAAARPAWLAAAQEALAEEDVSAACAHFGRLESLGFSSGAAGEWERIHYARALVVRDGYGIDAIDRLVGELALHAPLSDDAEAAERHFAANALYYLWSGGLSSTAGLAQAARLAGLARNPAQHYAALWGQANTTFLTGDFATAHSAFTRLQDAKLPFAERVRYLPSDPQSFIAVNRAWASWFLGLPSWRAETEGAVAQAAARGSQQHECIACCYAGAIYLCAGDWEAQTAYAARSMEIAQREAFNFWELFSALLVQISAARAGRAPDPAHCARFEAAIRTAYPAGLNTVRWFVAEAYAAARDWSAVRELCRTALREAEKSEHLYCAPDLWRLFGQALTESGEAPAGAAALHQAKSLADARGAEGWLLRWQDLLPEDCPSSLPETASLLQPVMGFAPSPAA
ncbi:MAG: AAA family ATPase [Rhodocyclaceae bacterium]|nr:AAA family ATPase [Rhodocyclaceae bacterium]